MLLLRSILFLFLLPGTAIMLIPYVLLSLRQEGSFEPSFNYWGLPLIVLGAAGLFWCVWQFYSEGRGTLAAIDAPKYLVVRGLYRYVRNPMYVCIVTILLGEAIGFRSWAILLEAGIFIIAVQLFITLYEEPVLRRQFGESYENYARKVGRWIPRLPS